MDYGITKTKTDGQCYNCNRMLTRKTGHVIFDNRLNDYVSACTFCLEQNPSLGR
jgi:hypothetical protein